jgi:hypothetical protein
MPYSYIQFFRFIFAFNQARKHKFQFFVLPYSATALVLLSVMLRARYIFGYSIEKKKIKVFLSYINKIIPVSHLISRVNRLSPIYHSVTSLRNNSVYLSEKGIYSTEEMRLFKLGGLLLFEVVLI